MKRLVIMNNILLILLLTIIKSSNGFRSSVCPKCDEHFLSCPNGQQIDISSAFHGFVQNNKICTECKTECCKYYKNDCLELYQPAESAPVMRCCGETNCTLKSPVGGLNYCDRHRPFLYNNISSYSEINYRCIEGETINPSEATDWTVLSSLQVVIDGMKPYYCTYNIISYRYNFFQTNTKGTNFRIHQNIDTRCNTHYSVVGYTIFKTQPYTDIFIVLSGFYRYHTYNSPQSVNVRYICSNDSNTVADPTESTTMVSAQTTEGFMLNEMTEDPEEFMEEETNNQTREEYEAALLMKGQENNRSTLVGSIVGSLGGLILLLIIILVIVIVIKKRQKRPHHDESEIHGRVNPGYGVTDPDQLSTVVASSEINVQKDNSPVEYLRDEVRFETLPEIQVQEYDNAHINASTESGYEILDPNHLPRDASSETTTDK